MENMNFDQPQKKEIFPDDKREVRGDIMTTTRTVRRTDDGQYEFFVEVYYASDPGSDGIRVTGIGPGMKGSEHAMSDLRKMIGRTFHSRRELNQFLNGSEREV
jgi:hypothetical protein